MAKNNNLTDFLTDLANAIREKKGTAGKINPQNFSSEIKSIQAGGGSGDVMPTASLNDVTFYDYNGHILYSYSYTDFLALNAMPELPSRTGLECTKWTHNIDEAKDYVAKYRRLNIGACYTTSNGRTQVYFDIYSDESLKRKFALSIDTLQGVTVYYGDGRSGKNGGTGARAWTVTYTKKGSYTVEVEPADGVVLGLGYNGSSKPFFGSDVYGWGTNYPYGAGLNKIYCGKNITYYHPYFAANHRMLQEIILTPAVSIGRNAFQKTSIRCAVVPPGITSIGEYSYEECSNLTNVIMPNTITQIGNRAFYAAYSLRTIDLPTSVTSIPEYCFARCYFLEVVTIPESVTSIGVGAFSDCVSLMLINMSQHNSVPTLGSTLPSQSFLKIVVPDALYDEWIVATNWSAAAGKIIKKSEWEG